MCKLKQFHGEKNPRKGGRNGKRLALNVGCHFKN
jgi:hypothetical protein